MLWVILSAYHVSKVKNFTKRKGKDLTTNIAYDNKSDRFIVYFYQLRRQ